MSSLVDMDVARLHCKADPADDTVLQRYLDAAEKICFKRMNRNVYVDQAALDAAVAAVPAQRVAANAAYEAAMTAAGALGTEADILDAETEAANVLRRTKVALSYASDGMVVEPDIVAAILLVTGHLYRNREEVLTGQGANAIVLPEGVERLLAPNRILGLM